MNDEKLLGNVIEPTCVACGYVDYGQGIRGVAPVQAEAPESPIQRRLRAGGWRKRLNTFSEMAS